MWCQTRMQVQLYGSLLDINQGGYQVNTGASTQFSFPINFSNWCRCIASPVRSNGASSSITLKDNDNSTVTWCAYQNNSAASAGVIGAAIFLFGE